LSGGLGLGEEKRIEGEDLIAFPGVDGGQKYHCMIDEQAGAYRAFHQDQWFIYEV
jgi:hypothetical protein